MHTGDTGITGPPTASVLPVSDKPVTLNFSKGPVATKPLVNASGHFKLSLFITCHLRPLSGPSSAKSTAPLALAFSLADDTDTNRSDGVGEKTSNMEDNKGTIAHSSYNRCSSVNHSSPSCCCQKSCTFDREQEGTY
jgi:hypothetical protein